MSQTATSGPAEPCAGQTIEEILAGFDAHGYDGQMAAREGGRLLCFGCRSESDAHAVELRAVCRTEGTSDPADMLAVAALRCPACGRLATGVFGYGPEATPEDAEVLRRLEDVRRPGARRGSTQPPAGAG